MPHTQCPPSRRGHTWRELTDADAFRATIKRVPELRVCARCRALGRVSRQGVIHVVEIA